MIITYSNNNFKKFTLILTSLKIAIESWINFPAIVLITTLDLDAIKITKRELLVNWVLSIVHIYIHTHMLFLQLFYTNKYVVLSMHEYIY